jgi:hypothetical protein
VLALTEKRKGLRTQSHRAVLAAVAASLQSPDAEEEEFDAESFEEEKSRHARYTICATSQQRSTLV